MEDVEQVKELLNGFGEDELDDIHSYIEDLVEARLLNNNLTN